MYQYKKVQGIAYVVLVDKAFIKWESFTPLVALHSYDALVKKYGEDSVIVGIADLYSDGKTSDHILTISPEELRRRASGKIAR